jgi:hypothetical protein
VKVIAVSLMTIFYVSVESESCYIEFVYFVKLILVVKARKVKLKGYASGRGTWKIYVYTGCFRMNSKYSRRW